MTLSGDGNVAAALVGAAAALLFTTGRDWFLARKRRKDVASALVCELRIRLRKLEADLEAAQGHKIIVFDPAPSEALHHSVMHDLPDLGQEAFAAIHLAYAQYRQIAYIKSRLQPRYESTGAFPDDDLTNAYLAATRQGVTRIKAALDALRDSARSRAFSLQLPTITQLTEIEKIFYRKTD